jgi:hypothetical protein
MDNTVIKKAKKTAKRHGVSLSRMVEDYFRSVVRYQEGGAKAPPVLNEVAGVLSGRAGAEGLRAGYRKHLLEKYR